MVGLSGDRSENFPLIEKKYGEKISFWFLQLKNYEATKYPEQIAYLKENFGFSQHHANTVVMYFRGSKTSKRFEEADDFIKKLDPKTAKTVKCIFATIKSKFPELELVIAWNQPMLRAGKDYVFGLSVAKNHITIAPWSGKVLAKFAPRLTEYEVNKKTIKVPLDWKIDTLLLHGLVRARIAEIKSGK